MSMYDRNTVGATGKPMWTHWVNLVVGVVLFFAPWLFAYSGYGNALWASLILGALIAIFAVWGLVAHSVGATPQWIAGALGTVTFIAPWLFGFSNLANALWSCLILGAIAVIVAAIGIFMRPRTPAV